MGLTGRYIFGATFSAFLVVLVSLTALIWVTQVIRDLDLVTNQGQGPWAFLELSALLIPLLVMIIAPIAFMVAMVHVLNRLSADSELIVMNAAGMSPGHLCRPFLAVGFLVSLLVAAIAAYGSPKSLRVMNQWLSEIRADLVTHIVQPGRFVSLAGGTLTLHIRERLPNGELLGIFIDDQRDPKERTTFLAEQGDIRTGESGTFLLLAIGSVQRQKAGDRDPNIVQFDQYAFDLSRLSPGNQSTQKYSARETYLWELFSQSPDDASRSERPEQMRAELHDRILAPLYPFVIAVLTFAYLGPPRTTRQGRTTSVLFAIGAVTVLRGSGFVGVLAAVRSPAALIAPYTMVLVALCFGYWVISREVVFEAPAFLMAAIDKVGQIFGRKN
jgi:lipopolysaccharide export system permease protein